MMRSRPAGMSPGRVEEGSTGIVARKAEATPGRGFGSTLALCIVVGLGLGLGLGVVGAEAQESGDRWNRWDPDYEPPRTAFGHPDLQGNWTNVTVTPLERDDEVEGLTYSPREVERLERRAEERFLAGLRPSDPDRPPPEAGGSTGGYNRIYIDRGERVAIVDGEARTSLVTDPPDGRIPELSAEGRARMSEIREFEAEFGEYDHPELRPLGERCIVSFGSSLGPPMVPNNFYNNNYTIVQNRDHVLILAEMVHDTRVIRLGDAEPLPESVRPWFGDSRGRWEGNTLVVETTNIHPHQTFRRIPPSRERRVVERFTRVDDDTILYEFEVHDPLRYSEPWGGEIPMERFDQNIYEYGCHEGNYALHNILSGARYQERMRDELDPPGPRPGDGSR